MRSPRWTVLANVVSPESNEFIGMSWEFFTDEKDASACLARNTAAGNTAMKRPFNEKHDRQYMHCTAKGSWRPWSLDSDLRQLPEALCELDEFRALGFKVKSIIDSGNVRSPLFGKTILVVESDRAIYSQLVDLYCYFREDGRLGVVEVGYGKGGKLWISVKLPSTTAEIGKSIIKELLPKLAKKYSCRV